MSRHRMLWRVLAWLMLAAGVVSLTGGIIIAWGNGGASVLTGVGLIILAVSVLRE